MLILFRDAGGDDSYVPVSIPLESLPESGISDEVLTYTFGQIQRTLDEIYLKNIEQDAALDDRVKKTGGDTMEGPLQITGPRVAGDDADNPDLVSSIQVLNVDNTCLLYTSPSPRDRTRSRMPSSA